MMIADLPPPEPTYCIMQEMQYPEKRQQLVCIDNHLFIVWHEPEGDALPVMKTDTTQMVCDCKAKTIDYTITVHIR